MFLPGRDLNVGAVVEAVPPTVETITYETVEFELDTDPVDFGTAPESNIVAVVQVGDTDNVSQAFVDVQESVAEAGPYTTIASMPAVAGVNQVPCHRTARYMRLRFKFEFNEFDSETPLAGTFGYSAAFITNMPKQPG